MSTHFKNIFIASGAIGVVISSFVVAVSFMDSSGAVNPSGIHQSATAALSQNSAATSPKDTQIPDMSEPKTLVFVGDVMLSRHIGKIMANGDDWRFPFQYVRDFLRSADLVFGNLEGPISGRGTNQGSIYSFNADPYAVQGLTDAHFKVMSVANNHILDYGPQALLDTLSVLKVAGIAPVGAGVDYASAHTSVIETVGDTRIAFLGYTNLLPASVGEKDATPAVARPDEETVRRDIGIVKQDADMVIVSFHWGDEYRTAHNAWQERMAHAAIDAGASLVIGHHPHVVQEVENYNSGYIAYSLGNFIFDQNFSPDTSKGLLLEAFVKDKKVTGIKTMNVSFNAAFQPIIEQ